jgi:hypothetical protein
MAFTISTVKDTVQNRDVAKPAALLTTIGTLYTNNLTTGLLEVATAALTANQITYRANANIAVIEGLTSVNSAVVSSDDEFVVDTVANSASAENGRRFLVNATGDKLTNGVADNANGVFVQINTVGAAADKKIIARKVA